MVLQEFALQHKFLASPMTSHSMTSPQHSWHLPKTDLHVHLVLQQKTPENEPGESDGVGQQIVRPIRSAVL